jgi:dienelactone hydrolase
MRLHQQFDLNTRTSTILVRDSFSISPYTIEQLADNLSKKGYTVMKSSAYFRGMPKSITVVKEFSGPFVTHFTAKMKEDFNVASNELGIKELFV